MKARSANPAGRRKNQVSKLKRYGMTIEQYDAILASQGGVCAICKEPEVSIDPRTNLPRALAVDHCHDKGNYRGLLCTRCNQGIGQFRHDLKMLHAAIAYLHTHALN